MIPKFTYYKFLGITGSLFLWFGKLSGTIKYRICKVFGISHRKYFIPRPNLKWNWSRDEVRKR